MILNQKPKVIWFTGLSGAGKTTMANELQKRLQSQGLLCVVLDGDALRHGINKDLGFEKADRFENVRRTAEIAKLFLDAGMVVITATISPKAAMRELASSIVGHNNFIEVFVNSSLKSCEARDVKGLYLQARQGTIAKFTGVSDLYEPPVSAFNLQTDKYSVEECGDMLFAHITPQISSQTGSQ